MLITPEWCALMARYNGWQNRSMIAAASTLPMPEMSKDRGAFFGSILGTFSHLLWADLIWMSRFDGGAPPDGGIPGSESLFGNWTDLMGRRATMDERIKQWTGGLTKDALAQELTWMSGALGREVTKPLEFCVAHFFNHQTHHRGQIHVMLTAAGARPDDTDLFILPEDA